MKRVFIDLAREHLARGMPLTLEAEGHSMWPLIQHGDRITVEPPLPPQLGDLVLVDLQDRLVLHRVIAITHTHITTKGDAVPHADPPIAPTAILGVLARTAPRFNRACAFVSASATDVSTSALASARSVSAAFSSSCFWVSWALASVSSLFT